MLGEVARKVYEMRREQQTETDKGEEVFLQVSKHFCGHFLIGLVPLFYCV